MNLAGDPTTDPIVELFDDTVLSNAVVEVHDDATGVTMFDGGPALLGTEIVDEETDTATDVGVRISGPVTGAVLDEDDIGGPGAGFFKAIEMESGADALISDNVFLGTHDDGGTAGAGIDLLGNNTAAIENNLFTVNEGPASAIQMTAVAPAPGVAMTRNKIESDSQSDGIVLQSSTGPVTMRSDLITGADRGLVANGAGISLTNVTIADVTTGAELVGSSALTADSSIFTAPISVAPLSTCAISFSRGPTATPGGDGCANFQTTADPAFVGPSNYHLDADSPLIDAGNPAAPGAGVTDLDGDARAIDGDGICPIDPVRDIGADEVVVTQPDCEEEPPPPPPPPPPPGDTTAPDTSIAGKKKQRGKRAKFTLSATEGGSTFECKVDRRPWEACEAAYRTPKLKKGRHKLRVRATDEAGNTDATAARKKFKLKRRSRR